MPRVLCVAEKPSIARAISEILSGGQFITVHDLYPTYAKTFLADLLRHHSEMAPANTTKTSISRIPKPTHTLLSLPYLGTCSSMIFQTLTANGIHAILLSSSTPR
jgi:hypothetical protein